MGNHTVVRRLWDRNIGSKYIQVNWGFGYGWSLHWNLHLVEVAALRLGKLSIHLDHAMGSDAYIRAFSSLKSLPEDG